MDTSRKRALIGVVVGHAAHDTWFGVAPVLLAALSSSLGLSNADIGLVLLIYQSVSSLTQPFFGRLSDAKHAWMGGRTMAVVAILWTTALFGGVILAPSKIFLFLFIGLAGFGSGAFHPQGAAT
ncbi:MAG: MFS transporter, partial [Chloroflexi bacterium]|nr:MFS transporter [Chloroflexota bacterium]